MTNNYEITYDGLFDGTHADNDTAKSYADVFEEQVTLLTRTVDNNDAPPPLEVRRQMVDDIIEAHVEQTGERPHGTQLYRLANFILLDDLTDSHPDKVTRTEYPIMNKRQLKLRQGRELSNENDSLNYAKVRKEIPKKTNRGFNINEL